MIAFRLSMWTDCCSTREYIFLRESEGLMSAVAAILQAITTTVSLIVAFDIIMPLT